jgi:hypothetical protein
MMGFLSNLAFRVSQAGQPMLGQQGEWDALFGQTGAAAGIPLGTARWIAPEAVVERFGFSAAPPGSAPGWIGEGFDPQSSPLGYPDDRHICLVSGSRARPFEPSDA